MVTYESIIRQQLARAALYHERGDESLAHAMLDSANELLNEYRGIVLPSLQQRIEQARAAKLDSQA